MVRDSDWNAADVRREAYQACRPMGKPQDFSPQVLQVKSEDSDAVRGAMQKIDLQAERLGDDRIGTIVSAVLDLALYGRDFKNFAMAHLQEQPRRHSIKLEAILNPQVDQSKQVFLMPLQQLVRELLNGNLATEFTKAYDQTGLDASVNLFNFVRKQVDSRLYLDQVVRFNNSSQLLSSLFWDKELIPDATTAVAASITEEELAALHEG